MADFESALSELGAALAATDNQRSAPPHRPRVPRSAGPAPRVTPYFRTPGHTLRSGTTSRATSAEPCLRRLAALRNADLCEGYGPTVPFHAQAERQPWLSLSRAGDPTVGTAGTVVGCATPRGVPHEASRVPAPPECGAGDGQLGFT